MLLQQVVVWSDGDHRHVCVDQRERAVLQFARRIGFRVNVGNFLQLQRPLHRDRVERAAAQEQGVALLGEALREPVNDRVELERSLDERGELDEARNETSLPLSVGAVMLR